MPKSKKEPKHPKDMTTEELGKHLFGPDLHQKLKDLAHNQKPKPNVPPSSHK